MQVRFIYESDDYDKAREVVVEKICEYLSYKLDLPNQVEVKFSTMMPGVYAHTALDPRFKNRITINSTLKASEIAPVVLHEMIHVHQVHIGRLDVTRNGTYIWDKKRYPSTDPTSLEINKYLQLPWELDVANKQQQMLQEALNFVEKRSKQ